MSSLNNSSTLPTDCIIVGVSETEATYETFAEARKFFCRPHHIHLVVPHLTETDWDVITDLEQRHYRFGTKRNDAFHLRFYMWHDILWGIVSIPHKDEPLVSKHCALYGRYLDRGIFTILQAHQTEQFPFKGDRFRAVRIVGGRCLAIP